MKPSKYYYSLSESETRTLALGVRPVKSKPNYRDTSDHRSSDSGASKSDRKSPKHSLKRLTRSLEKSSNRGPDRCRRKSNILSPRPNVFFDNEANKNVVIKDSFIKGKCIYIFYWCLTSHEKNTRYFKKIGGNI